MRRAAVVLLLLSSLGACVHDPPASQKFVVFFEEWSAGLDGNAQAVISTAAGWAKLHPAQVVTVTGFAAPDGGQQANVSLSRTRAQVVVDQLTQDGVDRSRIRVEAKGPTDFTLAPVESRRVEIGVASL